jgi:hypothetical protein
MTSVERVRCECGKEYRVFAPDQQSSIRCHMCGRLIDLSFFKAAIAERKAAEAEREAAVRTLAHREKVDQAARVNFAGLRFDGVYRTPSAVQFEGAFASALELSLRFNGDLVVDYIFTLLDEENGAPIEVDRCSRQTGYGVTSEGAIRLAFDGPDWFCEW